VTRKALGVKFRANFRENWATFYSKLLVKLLSNQIKRWPKRIVHFCSV